MVFSRKRSLSTDKSGGVRIGLISGVFFSFRSPWISSGHIDVEDAQWRTVNVHQVVDNGNRCVKAHQKLDGKA